jgi:hypothetical protein|tara:strand:+ start:386 stop:733 length:348 start_codon:yes stop_codon:yes gene_type:complete
MARERINIIKSAYRTNEIGRVVDREFKTFTKPVEEVDTDTVEELFRLYDKLYFTIPLEGETNSHQYLLQKSSELVDLEKSTEDLQPLLDEIGQLRQQLLNANQQLFELENGQEGI